MITWKLVFNGKNIKILIHEDLNLLTMGGIGKLLHKGYFFGFQGESSALIQSLGETLWSPHEETPGEGALSTHCNDFEKRNKFTGCRINYGKEI